MECRPQLRKCKLNMSMVYPTTKVIYVTIRDSCGGGGKARSDSAEGEDSSSFTRDRRADAPLRAYNEVHHPLKQYAQKNRHATSTAKTRIKHTTSPVLSSERYS